MNNLLKRSIFGVVYGAVMVLGLLCGNLYPLLCISVMLLSLHEFFSISAGAGVLVRERAAAVLAALCFFCLIYAMCRFGIDVKYLSLVLLPLLALNILYIFEKDRSTMGSLACLYFGLVYIALPIGLSPVLVYSGENYDGRIFLSLFILIWMSDMGAYFVGSALGQKPGARKLAPSISPKKSWWGVAGGLVFSVLAGFVLNLVGWFQFSLIHSIMLSMTVCAGAIAGDLCESVWKRHFGIKDSGNVIPGHGGMLDRFDSALVAVPLGAIYLSMFSLL